MDKLISMELETFRQEEDTLKERSNEWVHTLEAENICTVYPYQIEDIAQSTVEMLNCRIVGRLPGVREKRIKFMMAFKAAKRLIKRSTLSSSLTFVEDEKIKRAITMARKVKRIVLKKRKCIALYKKKGRTNLLERFPTPPQMPAIVVSNVRDISTTPAVPEELSAMRNGVNTLVVPVTPLPRRLTFDADVSLHFGSTRLSGPLGVNAGIPEQEPPNASVLNISIGQDAVPLDITEGAALGVTAHSATFGNEIQVASTPLDPTSTRRQPVFPHADQIDPATLTTSTPLVHRRVLQIAAQHDVQLVQPFSQREAQGVVQVDPSTPHRPLHGEGQPQLADTPLGVSNVTWIEPVGVPTSTPFPTLSSAVAVSSGEHVDLLPRRLSVQSELAVDVPPRHASVQSAPAVLPPERISMQAESVDLPGGRLSVQPEPVPPRCASAEQGPVDPRRRRISRTSEQIELAPLRESDELALLPVSPAEVSRPSRRISRSLIIDEKIVIRDYAKRAVRLNNELSETVHREDKLRAVLPRGSVGTTLYLFTTRARAYNPMDQVFHATSFIAKPERAIGRNLLRMYTRNLITEGAAKIMPTNRLTISAIRQPSTLPTEQTDGSVEVRVLERPARPIRRTVPVPPETSAQGMPASHTDDAAIPASRPDVDVAVNGLQRIPLNVRTVDQMNVLHLADTGEMVGQLARRDPVDAPRPEAVPGVEVPTVEGVTVPTTGFVSDIGDPVVVIATPQPEVSAFDQAAVRSLALGADINEEVDQAARRDHAKVPRPEANTVSIAEGGTVPQQFGVDVRTDLQVLPDFAGIIEASQRHVISTVGAPSANEILAVLEADTTASIDLLAAPQPAVTSDATQADLGPLAVPRQKAEVVTAAPIGAVIGLVGMSDHDTVRQRPPEDITPAGNAEEQVIVKVKAIDIARVSAPSANIQPVEGRLEMARNAGLDQAQMPLIAAVGAVEVRAPSISMVDSRDGEVHAPGAAAVVDSIEAADLASIVDPAAGRSDAAVNVEQQAPAIDLLGSRKDEAHVADPVEPLGASRTSRTLPSRVDKATPQNGNRSMTSWEEAQMQLRQLFEDWCDANIFEIQPGLRDHWKDKNYVLQKLRTLWTTTPAATFEEILDEEGCMQNQLRLVTALLKLNFEGLASIIEENGFVTAAEPPLTSSPRT